MGLRHGEAAEQQATQLATLMGPMFVSAQVGEFILFVLFVAALIAGYLLPSASWRLVQKKWRLGRACRASLPRWRCMRPCRASGMSCAPARTVSVSMTVRLEMY